MNIKCLAEHSFDLDLLTGGRCLDVGCRYFHVTRELLALGESVVAVDPDPNVVAPPEFLHTAVSDNRVDHVSAKFLNVAIDSQPGTQHLAVWGNGTGNYLTSVAPAGSHQTFPVSVETIKTISDKLGVTDWDAIKLDCEGAEYRILATLDRPWAKQFSVEFHEHCVRVPQSTYDVILAHMGQWYDVHQLVRESRHGCGMNYWDVLFVRH